MGYGIKGSFKYRKLPTQFIQKELDVIKVTDSTQRAVRLYESPEKIIDKGLIININSVIGENAGVLTTMIAKKLISKGFKEVIFDGFSFNQNIVDFNTKDNYLDRITEADFILFYFYNVVDKSEFKQGKLLELCDFCRLHNKPLIITTTQGFKTGLNEISITVADIVKKPADIFDSLFKEV